MVGPMVWALAHPLEPLLTSPCSQANCLAHVLTSLVACPLPYHLAHLLGKGGHRCPPPGSLLTPLLASPMACSLAHLLAPLLACPTACSLAHLLAPLLACPTACPLALHLVLLQVPSLLCPLV